MNIRVFLLVCSILIPLSSGLPFTRAKRQEEEIVTEKVVGTMDDYFEADVQGEKVVPINMIVPYSGAQSPNGIFQAVAFVYLARIILF